jgi:hypothetical protein
MDKTGFAERENLLNHSDQLGGNNLFDISIGEKKGTSMLAIRSIESERETRRTIHIEGFEEFNAINGFRKSVDTAGAFPIAET